MPCRGFQMVAYPHGFDHGDGVDSREPLPGRRIPGGAPGGVPLPPRGPHQDLRVPGGQGCGIGGPLLDLHPCASPSSRPRPAASTPNGDRLPRPCAGRLRGRHPGGDQLPPACRGRRCRRADSTKPGDGGPGVMSRSPWVTHFGFSQTPFTKSIAARDLFGRGAHDEAVARIGFIIAESSLGLITGEVGVGKTVALRAAVANLDPLRHHLIYLSNPPALGTRGLHVSIVSALGGRPRFFRTEVAAQAGELLAAEESERHRRVILAIDEAHLLSPAQLEETRLLTN